jgi:heme-degrading monooxygenase HmoA
MIVRHWTGVTKKEDANAYITYLEQDTFKMLMTLNGFIDASILKREIDDGTEFLIVTTWHSLEAIKVFTGAADVDSAIVPQTTRNLMIRFDEKVKHYEIAYAVYTH